MSIKEGLTEADILAISDRLAGEVVRRLIPIIESRRKLLIGRVEMAELIGVSLATLDRLVSKGVVSSLVLMSRRMFDGERVLAELTDAYGVEAVKE